MCGIAQCCSTMETFLQGVSQGILPPQNTLENAAPHPDFTGKRKLGSELELQAWREDFRVHPQRHQQAELCLWHSRAWVSQYKHTGRACWPHLSDRKQGQVGFIHSSPTSSLRQDLGSGLGTSWWHFLHTDVSEVFVHNQTVTRAHGKPPALRTEDCPSLSCPP